MTLKRLLDGYPVIKQQGDAEVTQLAFDSRQVKPGAVFVAIPGHDRDGHDFISHAIAQGAVGLITQLWIETDTPQIQVADTRRALSYAAAKLYDHPAKKMTMIGITGTKGKTSVSHLLYEIALRSGKTPALIGTNGVRYQDKDYITPLTTPEALDLQQMLYEMEQAGVDTVFMEVSSGGVKLKRVADILFDIAVFTNLAPDHIGPNEHATMEEYTSYKSQLFLQAKQAVINIDDAVASQMMGQAGKDHTYGKMGDFMAHEIVFGKTLNQPTRFKYKGLSSFSAELATPGEYSVYNALAVIGVSELLGYPSDVIQQVLATHHVDGRTEILPAPEGIQIVVDFAHNQLSIKSILTTLREYEPKRLIILIGSVGGRTKNRRQEIGEAIVGLADIVMLTADNPDYEDPRIIIEDMAGPLIGQDIEVLKEPDREQAIKQVLAMLEPGDLFLLAGKGHENYQLIDGEKLPFSDKAVVAEYYRSLK